MGRARRVARALQLGVELRPSYLHYSFLDTSQNRNLLMNADVHASFRAKDWLFYGQIGRELEQDGHTAGLVGILGGLPAAEGVGFRAGRFLPAYGVRFADHTSFNRSFLGSPSTTRSTASRSATRAAAISHRSRWARAAPSR